MLAAKTSKEPGKCSKCSNVASIHYNELKSVFFYIF